MSAIESLREFLSSRSKISSIFAGLLFFAGWWILIDAMAVNHKHEIATGHVFIGIFGTLSLLMVNSVKNSDISDEGSRAMKAKIFLLIGFLMGFSVIFAAIWVMIVDFIKNPEKSTSAGVALLMQNVCILLASLSYKLGRNEDNWE